MGPIGRVPLQGVLAVGAWPIALFLMMMGSSIRLTTIRHDFLRRIAAKFLNRGADIGKSTAIRFHHPNDIRDIFGHKSITVIQMIAKRQSVFQRAFQDVLDAAVISLPWRPDG